MRVISGLILLLTILPVFAQQAAPEVLVRRLYINLLDRFPSVEEVRVGRKKIVNYEGFVDELLAEKEFSGNLAQKITTHYTICP